MNAVQLLRNAMGFIDRFATPLIEDMRDAPLQQPTPRGGNHPLWVVGHLATSEAFLYSLIRDEPNPVAHWGALFAPGTEPTTDVAMYPPYEDVYERYREIRGRTSKLLDELSEEDLARPPRTGPEEVAGHFPTCADVLMTIVLHHECHIGQLSDARRAAGRKPMFK